MIRTDSHKAQWVSISAKPMPTDVSVLMLLGLPCQRNKTSLSMGNPRLPNSIRSAGPGIEAVEFTVMGTIVSLE